MGILEEEALDHGFEESWVGCQVCLQLSDGSLEGERGERIGIVEPGGQGAQHQIEPPRETAAVVLSQPKFDGVHGGFNGLRIDSLAGENLEGFQDERFNLIGGSRVDALQPGGKIHLAKFTFQPHTSQIISQPGLDERLAQG